jgi:hypothetical protein
VVVIIVRPTIGVVCCFGIGSMIASWPRFVCHRLRTRRPLEDCVHGLEMCKRESPATTGLRIATELRNVGVGARACGAHKRASGCNSLHLQDAGAACVIVVAARGVV